MSLYELNYNLFIFYMHINNTFSVCGLYYIVNDFGTKMTKMGMKRICI